MGLDLRLGSAHPSSPGSPATCAISIRRVKCSHKVPKRRIKKDHFSLRILTFTKGKHALKKSRRELAWPYHSLGVSADLHFSPNYTGFQFCLPVSPGS